MNTFLSIRVIASRALSVRPQNNDVKRKQIMERLCLGSDGVAKQIFWRWNRKHGSTPSPLIFCLARVPRGLRVICFPDALFLEKFPNLPSTLKKRKSILSTIPLPHTDTCLMLKCRSETEKYHPSGNLKFNLLGIFQSLKLHITFGKILSFSLKLKYHSKYFRAMG